MRYIYLILTLIVQLIAVGTLKLFENYSLIITFFFGCLLLGLIVYKLTKENNQIKHLGWGILFGSLTSLSLII